MIRRTHVAIGVFFILFFLPYISHKISFAIIVLTASLFPDIDTAYSSLGSRKIFRPLQWFVKHRGIIHSLTFCIAVSVVLAFYLPTWALPFFLGYSMHLFADSLTVEGIEPFWPFGGEVKGRLTTGGAAEDAIFFVFVVINIVLIIGMFL